MRTVRKSILLFFTLLSLLVTACVQEVWPEAGSGEVVIAFGAAPSMDVEVSTKGTLRNEEECRVQNLYVFVFDQDGQKIFGHFYDKSNLNMSSAGDYWTRTADGTSGTIHLKTTEEDNCTVVAICNIDAEMVNISPEQLGTIDSLDDIQKLKASLNQLTLSRSGYFPMSGFITDADLGSDGKWKYDSGYPTDHHTLELKRLDAKIKFNVQVDPGTEDIYDFTPENWQVVNLPRTSYVLEKTKHTPGSDAAVKNTDFFNSEAIVFETEELVDATYRFNTKKIRRHGFSFYMMENRKAPREHTDWKYTDREKQDKDTEEKNLEGFSYADDLATYVIITGRIEQRQSAGAQSSDVANVQYIVHLGNFGLPAHPDYSNFDVERNHTYTFNVFIKGVKDIYVEAHDQIEKEPGASGDILYSSGRSITCDSHYSTYTLVFKKDELDADRMNWWVQTPFNPDGADASAYAADPGSVDYQWVEFRVNADQKDGDGNYILNRWTGYKPRSDEWVYDNTKDISLVSNSTMTIPELIEFLNRTDAPFDGEGKMVVTAFVNEYYYETNPLTDKFEKDLWTKFVDQPMRTMCILSKIESSKDGESHVINSSFTIQQHSIQSVYNVRNIAETNLQSAWGCEYSIDDREALCKNYWKNRSNESRGNSDPDNGRWDSMIEWGLMGTKTSRAYIGDDIVDWSKFLNLADDDSSKPLMNTSSGGESYAYLRYSCLSRNRDNDGDGKIDKDELRWYMATSNQLLGLFLGSYGIEGAARLYQPTPEKWSSPYAGSYTNNEKWRQHILGSNCRDANSNSNDYVRIVWAEECMTGSTMQYTGTNDQTGTFSVRCVRNLGYDPGTGSDITYSGEDVLPDRLIVPTRRKVGEEEPYTGTWDNNSYYEIDCRRVNDKSLRYYTDRELVWHDENSEAACLYRYFTTAPASINVDLGANTTIRQLNLNINNNTVVCCPEGYHLPNVRELAIISFFLDKNDVQKYWGGNAQTVSRTYYSFGYEGRKFSPDNHWGWALRSDGSSYKAGMITASQTLRYPRCVKDVKL